MSANAYCRWMVISAIIGNVAGVAFIMSTDMITITVFLVITIVSLIGCLVFGLYTMRADLSEQAQKRNEEQQVRTAQLLARLKGESE